MEGADDRSIGIAGVDIERTVPYVDAHCLVLPDGRHWAEGETLEGVDDFVDGLLERRVPEGTGHVAAPSGSLGLGVLGGFVTVGVPQEGNETAYEQPQLGITAEERLAEAIPLRRATPPGRLPWLLFEDAGFEQAFEVGTHRGWMDTEDASQLGNLTRPFLEGFHDGQPARVTEEPMALRSYGMR